MPPCVVCKVLDLQHNDNDNDNVYICTPLAQRTEKVQGLAGAVELQLSEKFSPVWSEYKCPLLLAGSSV